jgi:hypothetical protein
MPHLFINYEMSVFVILIWEFISGAGYIGSVSFLESVISVVKKLKAINPDLIYGTLSIP